LLEIFSCAHSSRGRERRIAQILVGNGRGDFRPMRRRLATLRDRSRHERMRAIHALRRVSGSLRER
jgi:hypothetical protein